MKKIKTNFKMTTPPITIEFSGREAEELASLIANMDMKVFEKLVSPPDSSVKKFGVTPDHLDGLTDNLFEILMDHIEGRE